MAKVQMIIANPGEDANTSINISWHADFQEGVCIYTDSGWDDALIAHPSYHYCDCFNDVLSITPNREDCHEKVLKWHCRVNLQGLKPDTTYYYKIITDVESEVYTFKTGAKTFNFLWFADFHAYTPVPSRLESAISSTKKLIEKKGKADFILCGGDTVAWGGSYSFWDSLYQKDIVKNYMWVNILGNHDYMSRQHQKNTADYFRFVNNFPENGYEGQEGISYYFLYGDTLFIVINNEIMGFEKENDEVKKCIAWVEEILKKTKAKYIIFCEHYDWFQGLTGATRKFGYQRFRELFDKYNVDLAIGNNNHIYVRSITLKEDAYDEKGTVYIQAPSCDNERGQELQELVDDAYRVAKRWSEGAKTVGVLWVEVKDDHIVVELFDRNANLIDDTKIYQKERGTK